MNPFAVFVIAHAWDDDQTFIAATTRDGADAGRIGLPGGKVDTGESPIAAAIREAAEEGWQVEIPADSQPVHTALVDGRMVWWFAAAARPVKLCSWKEQIRGINPVWVTVSKAASSGFGNEFLDEMDFDLGNQFRNRGLAYNFSDFSAIGVL